MSLFLNGRIVYSGNSAYHSRDASFLGIVGLNDAVYLPLQSGENEILLLVTESFGLATAYFGAAGTLAFGALWGFVRPLPEQTQMNLDPLNRFNEPALHLDLTQRSGPILIMVEYDIAQENVTEFLATMADRRRIRLRDGARQWSLLRDLENPDRWFESYHLPTWTDYLRHVDRRTVADDEVIERLQALHRGPQPLTVHRMIERPTVQPLDDTPRIDHDSHHPH